MTSKFTVFCECIFKKPRCSVRFIDFSEGAADIRYLFHLSIFQAQSSRSSTWETVYEVSAPDATTITVQNLIPYSNYRLRIIANNIVGPSAPSEASPDFQTLQDLPAHPPSNMTVRAMSSTLLRVRWIVSIVLNILQYNS